MPKKSAAKPPSGSGQTEIRDQQLGPVPLAGGLVTGDGVGRRDLDQV